MLPSNLEYLLRQQSYNMQNQRPPAGWWSLWKGPKAIRHMICVHVCWSIYIITYYGMLLNIRSFSREHLEINTMIAGKNWRKNNFYRVKNSNALMINSWIYFRLLRNHRNILWFVFDFIHWTKMDVDWNIQYLCWSHCIQCLVDSTRQ